jgi:acyl-CoA thioester hydrolase
VKTVESQWQLHTLRVRYQETDQMSVVYHGNYVNWFEIGRTEFIRSAGMTYKEIEAQGLLLPVTGLEVNFDLPARYDDTLLICTRISQFSAVRLSFESQIRRIADAFELPAEITDAELPGELLVHGGTKHVWVNPEWKPVRLDKKAPALYTLLQGMVSGERNNHR